RIVTGVQTCALPIFARCDVVVDACEILAGGVDRVEPDRQRGGITRHGISPAHRPSSSRAVPAHLSWHASWSDATHVRDHGVDPDTPTLANGCDGDPQRLAHARRERCPGAPREGLTTAQ